MVNRQGTYEAYIIEDPTNWANREVRLLVREWNGAVLMADGTWKLFEEGSRQTEGIGYGLPREAIEAIAVAIQNWQGHTSHADTEAHVLREWLDVERGRVDKALDR